MLRRSVVVTCLAALAACTTVEPLELRIARLSPGAREELDRSRQFMTDNQIERYLAESDDDARQRYLDSLKIDDRLADYPEHVRHAIVDRRVVAGMDWQAVYLTWGKPKWRDRLDAAKSHGNVEELWHWEVTDPSGRAMRRTVTVLNGLVVDVEEKLEE
jgi:hypothetical protein